MNAPNWKNRTLFHGDNLNFLRTMNSESVHLIATDPPFKKDKDFHATPDSLASGASFQDRWSWERDVHEEWVDQITDDFPKVMNVVSGSRNSYGDDMGAYLCFMAVRLLEMHRVLKKGGGLYLHCDYSASHYLKELMDAIFDHDNFRNEIVWQRTTCHSDSKRYGANVDKILFYTKGGKWTWNTQYQPYTDEYKARFDRQDDDGRWWQDDNLTAYGLSGGGYEYKYKGKKALWRCPPETMERLDSENRLHFTRTGGIRLKKYLDESKGRPCQSLWEDVPPLNSQAGERTGWPTQKPLVLYERIIKSSSNKGDIILDPFAGCATTCVAAERLDRQWVGIDIWDEASNVVVDRLENEGVVSPNDIAGNKEVRQGFLFAEDLIFTSVTPERTDDGETAVPFLKTIKRLHEPPGPKMTRLQMYEYLLEQNGSQCEGCDREFDDPRYLELDHNTPRSDGGINHISNRILLCGPCNRLKSNTFTLSGLRRENKKRGYMAAL